MIAMFSYTNPNDNDSANEFLRAFLENKSFHALSNQVRWLSESLENPNLGPLERIEKLGMALNFTVVVDRMWRDILSPSGLHTKVALEQSVSEDMIGCFEQLCQFWIDCPLEARGKAEDCQYLPLHCMRAS